MKRNSIRAVFAGFLVIMAVCIIADFSLRTSFPETFGHSGANSTWLSGLVVIGYGAASCVVGGYLAAWLAASRPILHAAILGGVMILIALLGLIGSRAPVWFNLGYLAMILPCVCVGAQLGALQSQL